QGGLRWVARYGFVGMNTADLPVLSDGMNEKGLAAGGLLFPGYAGYQPYEEKLRGQTIAQYELVNWVLANFATVEEVRQALPQIRVCWGDKRKTGNQDLMLHYTVHDANGGSIVIEFVDGQARVYDNPLGVLTNAPTFDWMLTNIKNYVNLAAFNHPGLEAGDLEISGFGQGTGMLGLPGDYTPPSRFIRMLALTQSAYPVSGGDQGLSLTMSIINNIDIPLGAVRTASHDPDTYDRTMWVAISDLNRLRYYFRTYDNKNWRYIDVRKALQAADRTGQVMNIRLETPVAFPEVSDDVIDPAVKSSGFYRFAGPGGE
ncbi:MAG: choloylglycine hydrolase family protein, partial [Negativicutes bacterium]|nr:choloylglycine hydrolase family protein [Negativicutes bacterium]